MLRGLTLRLHWQQKHANLFPPSAQTAGFAKKKGKDDDSGPDPRITKLLKILEPKPKEKMPEMSAEDTAMWNEATKAYNKLKLAQHRVYMSDLSIKIQLKKAALAALPEHLRKEAEKAQTDLPPPNRQMFTWTPPIPGYTEQQGDASRRRRRG
ncbi:hypothetical protein CVIRNUC_004910 [Coccomyxa viridis]|uniref:Uncharacterized protein n=1 Tax=Coccomyxa viridis TaxID=1274662 RepID=A0AAV1I4S7_9CHLO|nr:hypothetical protein CVIRNUC_004910 [Coccomyxa viridis]